MHVSLCPLALTQQNHFSLYVWSPQISHCDFYGKNFSPHRNFFPFPAGEQTKLYSFVFLSFCCRIRSHRAEDEERKSGDYLLRHPRHPAHAALPVEHRRRDGVEFQVARARMFNRV